MNSGLRVAAKHIYFFPSYLHSCVPWTTVMVVPLPLSSVTFLGAGYPSTDSWGG